MFAGIFNNLIFRLTLTSLAILNLSACGGSGGSSKNTVAPIQVEKSNDLSQVSVTSTASISSLNAISLTINLSSSSSATSSSSSNKNIASNISISSSSSSPLISVSPANAPPSQPALLGGIIQLGELNLSTKVTTFAGATYYADGIGAAARFSYPKDITTDGINLYVADSYNHLIRQIEIATGSVTTLAGAIGKVGSVDDLLGIYDCFNAPSDCVDIKSAFFDPSRITTDGTYVYVDNMSDNKLRKIELSTNAVATVDEESGSGAAAMASQGTYKTTDGTNIYISNTRDFTISKIDIVSGVKTVIAGALGSSGSTDGTGVAAKFSYPKGIATDGTNLYVADTSNSTIRKIVIATGVVTTFAGAAGLTGSDDGIGTNARFYYPEGITTDGTSLYVADSYNNTIRKINIASGAVSTIAGIAGTGDGTRSTAGFYHPKNITSDGANLYIADTDNNTIRKIVIATGTVTTIAGKAGLIGNDDAIGNTARFDSPAGITTDGINVYVADTENKTIRKIEILTGKVTTIAGKAGVGGSTDGLGVDARFSRPTGITTDGESLYLTDSGNHTIRKMVMATGSVSTIAGTAQSPGSVDGIGAAARFSFPNGIATDGINLYVADSGNYTIRKIDIETGLVTTLAGTAQQYGSVEGIGALAKFSYVAGITTDGTNLYVADYNNRTIRKIVIATGLVSTLAGITGVGGSIDNDEGIKATFAYPEGIVTDGTNLYITDTNNNTIRKIE